MSLLDDYDGSQELQAAFAELNARDTVTVSRVELEGLRADKLLFKQVMEAHRETLDAMRQNFETIKALREEVASLRKAANA